MAENLAEIVSSARLLLKNWDGKHTVGDRIAAIRRTLAPLAEKVDELPADAHEKFMEINASLEQLVNEAFTIEQRDALDLLMLGLWIRIELFIEPMADD